MRWSDPVPVPEFKNCRYIYPCMTRHFIILLNLLACPFFCKTASQKKEAIRLANLGLWTYDSNTINADSLTKALYLLDSALKIYPVPIAHVYKYQIYRAMNRPLAALRECDSVFIIDSHDYYASLCKGFTFGSMGKTDSAFNYYRIALRNLNGAGNIAPEMARDHERIIIAALLKDTATFNQLVKAFENKYRNSKGELSNMFAESIGEFTHFRRDDYVQYGGYVHRDSVQATQVHADSSQDK